MSKTLEHLLKQSDLGTKRPLEVWRHLQGKANCCPNAAALARRASRDLEICQVRH